MGKGGSNEVPETEQEKALAEVAAQQYAEYRENGVPLEDAMIARSDQDVSDYERVAGQTNADIQKAASDIQTQEIADMSRSGINPNSGAVMARSDAVPQAAARAAVKANQSVTDRGLAEKQQMIAVGRGQATDALNSMQEQAATAASSAITDKKLEAQEANSTAAGIGAGVGMATAAYNKKPVAKGGV